MYQHPSLNNIWYQEIANTSEIVEEFNDQKAELHNRAISFEHIDDQVLS